MEHGHGEVSVLPLCRGRVCLDAQAQIEQSLESWTMPDERIEGAEQRGDRGRAGSDAAKRRRICIGVVRPSFDARAHDVSRLNERLELALHQFAVCDRAIGTRSSAQAMHVSNIVERAHA